MFLRNPQYHKQHENWVHFDKSWQYALLVFEYIRKQIRGKCCNDNNSFAHIFDHQVKDTGLAAQESRTQMMHYTGFRDSTRSNNSGNAVYGMEYHIRNNMMI